jgi:trimeric autotransporter adhesin
VCLGATLVVLGAILGGYFAAAGREAPRRATSPTTSSRTRAVRAATLPSPEHPYGLAVAPDGTLYVLDTGRDQILRRLASGRFQVFAGNGTSGFSGDGGPAPSARIEIQPSSGIAVASDGAVYFSDSGNGRVREVAPNGIITTVAGGGTVPLSSTDVPAHEATFGPSAPAGLAIGPDGELYIGAGSVYRLTAEGNLQWVVGEPENDTSPPAGWGGVYSNPAIQQDFSPAIRLAFDGRGDLLVAGGGGYGLYEKTTSGTLVFVENFRGDAYWGSLAESPAGNVILSARSGLSVFDPSGAITSVSADLNAPLGRMTGPGSRTPTGSALSNGFIGGDGVAVAPDGRIYVDTNSGNAFTSVSAIIAVAPTGNSTSTLWRS